MPENDASRQGRRRAHRKTKTGCLDCRQRRVKCDERKPVCSACVRRNRTCVWLTTSAHAVGSDSNRPASRTQSPSSRTPEQSSQAYSFPTPASSSINCLDAFPILPQPSGDQSFRFDLGDLALLHHWTFAACESICHASGEIEIWRRLFPEVGFQYSFVARALLSLAALHLAHETQDAVLQAQYVNRAISHHNYGLTEFRNIVTRLNKENSEALFIWSILNVVYVFGMLNLGAPGSSAKNKDQILGTGWIPMLHGVTAIVHPAYEHLVGGRLSTFLRLRNWDELDLDNPSNDADLELQRIKEAWEDSADKGVYDEALQILRRCRRFMDQFKDMSESELAQMGYNQTWSGPLIFIHVGPEAYFKLLSQRQPPALILFAHFGAMVYGLRKHWFIGDLGKNIVEAVDELLGSYWRPYLSWPLRFVHGNEHIA
ncbi:hypothetical protein NLU13_5045 [Sarocladium strictum]|uniref:Zn(2)-C6 fungal-type domain-containing protein n=1 Tax=Sarocladium strictum TaxID=5046 RepID=A0AA39L991_SARSR|nr:hypothetical protein NLU13_5045 [Sarocladium strictum]